MPTCILTLPLDEGTAPPQLSPGIHTSSVFLDPLPYSSIIHKPTNRRKDSNFLSNGLMSVIRWVQPIFRSIPSQPTALPFSLRQSGTGCPRASFLHHTSGFWLEPEPLDCLRVWSLAPACSIKTDQLVLDIAVTVAISLPLQSRTPRCTRLHGGTAPRWPNASTFS